LPIRADVTIFRHAPAVKRVLLKAHGSFCFGGAGASGGGWCAACLQRARVSGGTVKRGSAARAAVFVACRRLLPAFSPDDSSGYAYFHVTLRCCREPAGGALPIASARRSALRDDSIR